MKKDEAIDEFIRYMVGERGISKNTIITYKEDLMIFSSSTTKEEANDFNNNDIYEFIKGNNKLIELKQINREECIGLMKKYLCENKKMY